MKRLALALIAAFAMTQSASATPLTLSYTVSGTSTYLYSFTLALDNHDNSWHAGEGFNWITFGDELGSSAFTTGFAFGANTGTTGNMTFTSSNGGHNGPTLLDTTDIGLGWSPTAIGQSLTWTGTSTTLLGSGQLLWSNLIGSNSVRADFAVAQAGAPAAVPEPATLGLFGIALLGLGMAKRRKG